MKRKANWAILILILGAFMLAAHGCTGTFGGKETKSFTDMNTKEKATFLMSMYNKQYDDYRLMWKKEPRTEAMQKLLDDKHALLTELYPVVDVYAGYAESGGIPPAETEQLAIELVNRALGI